MYVYILKGRKKKRKTERAPALVMLVTFNSPLTPEKLFTDSFTIQACFLQYANAFHTPSPLNKTNTRRSRSFHIRIIIFSYDIYICVCVRRGINTISY